MPGFCGFFRRPMMEKDISRLLKEGAAVLGFHSIDEAQIKAFCLYLEELNVWKERMSLIRRRDDREIVIKDFIDSLTILKHLPLGSYLADLGSGAGFPGVPAKIIRPDLRVCLLESTRKKVLFLKHLVRILKLNKVEVRWTGDRNGQGMEDNGEFDFVVSRAFGSLEKFSSLGGSLLKKKGILLAMKARKGRQELMETLPLLERMGWKQTFLEQIRLPFLDHERTLIGLQKG
jgi:16S rRNA (guanine527-N7)-methyltransferase